MEYKCEFLDIVGDKCGTIARKFLFVFVYSKKGRIIPVCSRCSRIYLPRCPIMSEEEYMVQQVMAE